MCSKDEWKFFRFKAAGCTIPAFFFLAPVACAGITEGGPNALQDTRSLGSLIAAATTRSVHIIFVHGMRAIEEGCSETFRNTIREQVMKDRQLRRRAPIHGELSPRFDIGKTRLAQSSWAEKIWEPGPEWKHPGSSSIASSINAPEAR